MGDDIVDKVSNKVRVLLEKEIPIKSEKEWCERADEVLDVVRTGIQMRLEELEEEEDD